MFGFIYTSNVLVRPGGLWVAMSFSDVVQIEDYCLESREGTDINYATISVKSIMYKKYVILFNLLLIYIIYRTLATKLRNVKYNG